MLLLPLGSFERTVTTEQRYLGNCFLIKNCLKSSNPDKRQSFSNVIRSLKDNIVHLMTLFLTPLMHI